MTSLLGRGCYAMLALARAGAGVGGDKRLSPQPSAAPAAQSSISSQTQCVSLPITVHTYSYTRRNERSQLLGNGLSPTGHSGHAPLLPLRTPDGPPRQPSRVSIRDAEPTRAAACRFVGPRCATKSLRGCFTASASSACRSLFGRRYTLGVARGRAHIHRQVT